MIRHIAATLLLAAVAAGSWAAWLGWDQQRTEHPDGHTTGPYEAWQVAGLVVTLLIVGGVAAYRRYAVATTLGVTVGLTAAVVYDWSDDSSGLWAVGASMVAVGTLVVTAPFALLFSTFARRRS